MKKKYYVIATVWSEEHKNQVKVIAGEFDNHMNATIFRDAYNEHYNTDAIVADEWAMLNTNIMSR